jgi:hypothetical protein
VFFCRCVGVAQGRHNTLHDLHDGFLGSSLLGVSSVRVAVDCEHQFQLISSDDPTNQAKGGTASRPDLIKPGTVLAAVKDATRRFAVAFGHP